VVARHGAHANIILFVANTNSYNDLFTAVDTARNLPGVSAVSMSFGGGGFGGETGFDSHFVTPGGHNGVTFFASTGDNGVSRRLSRLGRPNVVAVGGTSLFMSDGAGTYSAKAAGAAGGGGQSTVEAEPAYQQSVQNSGFRQIPDISMDADPNTGVPIYDTANKSPASPCDSNRRHKSRLPFVGRIHGRVSIRASLPEAGPPGTEPHKLCPRCTGFLQPDFP